MLPTEFVLFSNHQALRYLNSQKKLNSRHAKWVEFLNEYSFVINHRAGVENKAANALSRLADLNWFRDARLILFIYHFIKFSFSKILRPDSTA